jgi:hypothetical protein
MIIYSINDYLQNDNDLLTTSDQDSIIFRPFLGSDDDAAPIFLYQYNPDIKSQDQYYIHTDSVWYTVLDTDVDRGFNLQNIIINILNKADRIQETAIDDTFGRLLYSTLSRTIQRQPSTVEGYYQLSALFEICWVPLD